MSNSFIILTFHALDELDSVTSFSPRLFKRGMARLYEKGYKTLSISDAAEYLRRDTPFPERSFAITFDDGYQSVYGEAFPILQRYGFSATIFLTVGQNGPLIAAKRLPAFSTGTMLSWNEIKEMQGAGIRVGAHTVTHPDLTRLPLERLKVEICDSKTIIEDALGIKVDCFAYPFGRYDKCSREIVRQHFNCACSDTLSLVTSNSDLFALERVDSYYLRTERLFNLMSGALFPLYVKARNVPRRIRRAVQLG